MAGKWTPARHPLTVALILLNILQLSRGQVYVSLRAPSLGVSTAYTVYYLNGSSTAQVGQFYLPACRAEGLATGGNGQYIRLTNTNTSTTVAERGAFDLTPAAIATLLWNTSSHDTLDPTYTGLYRCTSDVGDAPRTYQLNVERVCS
ncbi:uncharacterized protein LOC135827219 [Sycon ciliatum]|uniref:uncharacterized protein LOC135827219 n=1 Tax=Sycon ciliatum TaxID=27933 RepID=UPI0031F72248